VTNLTGLEKFSHLEDKIYRAIELCKTLRQQRDQLEQELNALTQENHRLVQQVEHLLIERDEIRLKVESMLDAIAIIEPETNEVLHS
jgi:FtsZ-binding cell division protein ZapB